MFCCALELLQVELESVELAVSVWVSVELSCSATGVVVAGIAVGFLLTLRPQSPGTLTIGLSTDDHHCAFQVHVAQQFGRSQFRPLRQ